MPFRTEGAAQLTGTLQRTLAPGRHRPQRGRSFLCYRFVDGQAAGGADRHIVEEYHQINGDGGAWRATHRTAIALPEPLAGRLATDADFAAEVLGYAARRRMALEKTTVVYDPNREHGIERLFPKWLYVRRDGGMSRESLACVPVPADILALMKDAPANFMSTVRWREWVDAMPAIDAADPRTDAVPPRITALVLASPKYFTTPDYRTWIGRTKQRKREEIIARELAAMHGGVDAQGALAASVAAPIQKPA